MRGVGRLSGAVGRLAGLAAVILCGALGARAQEGAKAAAIPPPPMGWSSWNSFSNTVDAQIVMEQAKAMVSTGLAKAGYRQINIDEGWWLGERDAEGNIVVDAKAWPALAAGEKAGDMANIVRYIHGLGLKAGIYTDAGGDGCSLYPDLGPVYHHVGSEGHYEQDFLQFAKWGFDYVKVDWCGGDKENLDPAVQYAEIGRAILQAEAITGHRLYFSLCEWGKNSPWTWAPGVGGVTGDVWRTSGDIVDPIVASGMNAGRKASFAKMLGNFDQGIHPEAEHTGFYNDPDMMVLGMPGLTDAENRVHMGLWAMSGAPLLVGADLTKLSAATLATLTNAAVLAVDQDGVGLQAVRVATHGEGLEVWSKPLEKSGQRAVMLLNRTAGAAAVAAHWNELGLAAGAKATVTDLWTGKDLGSFADSYTATVNAGDAVLLRVDGSEGKFASYKPEAGARETVRFSHVVGRGAVARVEIVYTNAGKAARFGELRVNGRTATRIAFPPSGGEGAVWIEAVLDRAGAGNVLEFAGGVGIQAIAVQ